MNGFEKRTEQLKKRIKNAALELLSTMEPRAIRITDIVKQADVSQVTIYNHFGSKENLIREALQSWYVNAVDEVEEYISDPSRSFQEIIQYLIFYKKKSVHTYSTAKLNELMLKDPEMKAFVNEIYRERALPLMIKIIDRGKESGEIKQDLPQSLILLYLNIFQEKAEVFADYAAAYPDEDAFVEDMMNLFFYGIAGR